MVFCIYSCDAQIGIALSRWYRNSNQVTQIRETCVSEILNLKAKSGPMSPHRKRTSIIKILALVTLNVFAQFFAVFLGSILYCYLNQHSLKIDKQVAGSQRML